MISKEILIYWFVAFVTITNIIITTIFFPPPSDSTENIFTTDGTLELDIDKFQDDSTSFFVRPEHRPDEIPKVDWGPYPIYGKSSNSLNITVYGHNQQLYIFGPRSQQDRISLYGSNNQVFYIDTSYIKDHFPDFKRLNFDSIYSVKRSR